MKKLESVTGQLSSLHSQPESLSRTLLATYISELGHARFSLLFFSTPGHPNLSSSPRPLNKGLQSSCFDLLNFSMVFLALVNRTEVPPRCLAIK